MENGFLNGHFPFFPLFRFFRLFSKPLYISYKNPIELFKLMRKSEKEEIRLETLFIFSKIRRFQNFGKTLTKLAVVHVCFNVNQ